jgi:hypothetical protein
MSNKEQRVILRERVKNFFVKNYFTITCKRLKIIRILKTTYTVYKQHT